MNLICVFVCECAFDVFFPCLSEGLFRVNFWPLIFSSIFAACQFNFVVALCVCFFFFIYYIYLSIFAVISCLHACCVRYIYYMVWSRFHLYLVLYHFHVCESSKRTCLPLLSEFTFFPSLISSFENWNVQLLRDLDSVNKNLLPIVLQRDYLSGWALVFTLFAYFSLHSSHFHLVIFVWCVKFCMVISRYIVVCRRSQSVFFLSSER